ncbi:uncharacterized protein DS421_14g447110 [Arachis hypogaea]|nr:uncharacterized protein DS421_14g447110 [Arachis hypogaea]
MMRVIQPKFMLETVSLSDLLISFTIDGEYNVSWIKFLLLSPDFVLLVWIRH